VAAISALIAPLIGAISISAAHAGPTTVCTITVNSSDEKEAFRRSLPADKYRFIELVERGRPDWLASACHQGIRCDVLVISGHYDGRDEFYSDRPGVAEFLPVEELERASCSKSCAGLFSQLKEVFLFGCNTLNPEALKRFSPEIVRSLVREGHSPAEADRMARSLASLHGGSSRDRMRVIFDSVPVIYGFSAKAPVGPVAASMLSGYFRSGGAAETGSGRMSGKLLSHFRSTSMAVSGRLSPYDPLNALRRDYCALSDDGLGPAQKLAFIQQVLNRDMAQARPFLDRIEKYVGSLSEGQRATAGVSGALEAIAHDAPARERFLAFARDADDPTVRARMIELAHRLRWLTPGDERAELAALIVDRIAGNVTPADVELACSLNDDHHLEDALPAIAAACPAPTLGQTAVLACLGSIEARRRLLPALSSPRGADFEMARVYLKHHPLTDIQELRSVTAEIASTHDPDVQIRMLDTLACQRVSDPETLNELARLFPLAQTADVQGAIAGVLLRSDYEAFATPEIVQNLRQSRIESGGPCSKVVDALIRHLDAR
jgi:hypothetical protein